MRNVVFIQLLSLSLVLQVGLSYAHTSTSPQDISLESQQVSSLISGRDAFLNDVVVDGKLIVGRDLNAQRCKVMSQVTVGRDLQLTQCEQVFSITAGRNADLSNTDVSATVAVGHNLTLNTAILKSETQVGNQVIAENSTIQGPLLLQGNYLKLDHSTANVVTFKKNPEPSLVMNSGSLVQHTGHHSIVQVGANSLSSVNGYTIKGTSNKTTVITPEEAIYVNAHKVSGEGPKTYADYQSAHPEAPKIQGPGWQADTAESKVSSKIDKNSFEIPINTVELMNNSKINSAVVFESGYGKILVHPGSEFTGKVTNGRVEHVAN